MPNLSSLLFCICVCHPSVKLETQRNAAKDVPRQNNSLTFYLFLKCESRTNTSRQLCARCVFWSLIFQAVAQPPTFCFFFVFVFVFVLNTIITVSIAQLIRVQQVRCIKIQASISYFKVFKQDSDARKLKEVVGLATISNETRHHRSYSMREVACLAQN